MWRKFLMMIRGWCDQQLVSGDTKMNLLVPMDRRIIVSARLIAKYYEDSPDQSDEYRRSRAYKHMIREFRTDQPAMIALAIDYAYMEMNGSDG